MPDIPRKKIPNPVIFGCLTMQIKIYDTDQAQFFNDTLNLFNFHNLHCKITLPSLAGQI